MALEMEDSCQAELCFQLRDTKPSGGDIQLMEWSPKMDLLAAALADHSVILNRLSWQRVWTIPPLESSVGSLVWRPDGRVLAVGCSNGVVLLFEVERADKVHQFNVHSPVTTMRWQFVELEGCSPMAYTDESTAELPPLPAVVDSASTFAADPALHSDKHLEAVQIIHSMPASGLSILTVGSEDGCVHLWVGGVLHAGTVRLIAETKTSHHPVVHLDVTEDLQWLIAAHWDDSHQLNVSAVSISIISNRVAELQHLAVVFSHLSSHLQYTNCAIRAMVNSWEGVLHMMENKLAGYAATLPSGVTVSDEFLMLLACGSASTELQEFLLDDLTANGLKKLGSSLQHSYNNIQKYASNHLLSVVQCLQYNLTHLLGLSSWYDRFGVLGLSRPGVERGLKVLGSFALKNLELLRVIDSSLKSIAAFSIWLYKVIVKLSNEKLPDGVDESLSTEDLGLIMDFLPTRLSKPSTEDHGQFSLELVGQYFSDDNLSIVQESSSTFWDELLQEAGIEKNCLPTHCEPCPEKSLLQLFNMLLNSIDSVFTAVADTTGSHMSVSRFGSVSVAEGEGSPTSSIGGFVSEGRHHLFFLHDSASGGVVSVDLPSGQLKMSRYNFSTLEEDADSCSLCALKYYSDESLSVAMETRKDKVIGCVLAQLSTALLVSLNDKESSTAPPRDVSDGLSQVWRCEGFQPGKLAVSGPRRLACLLSKSHKTVKLFDAEAEEESITEDTGDS